MLNLNKELYSYIINNLGAYWNKKIENATNNLNNGEEENKNYLGTYFIRSYIESYNIFINNLNALIQLGYLKEDNLKIMVLGSGSGGDLFGLLHVLEEIIEKPMNIDIILIDGNRIALKMQKRILEDFWTKNTKHTINISYNEKKFNNQTSLYDYIDKFENIDIMLTSKFLSEMLIYDSNIYNNILKRSNNILNENGLICIVDISCEVKTNATNKKYAPYILNNNIRNYMRNNPELFLLFPICCSNNIIQCGDNRCYTKHTLKMKYITQNNTINIYFTKFNFRIFVKKGDLFHKLKPFIQKMIEKCGNKCITDDKAQCFCSWKLTITNN